MEGAVRRQPALNLHCDVIARQSRPPQVVNRAKLKCSSAESACEPGGVLELGAYVAEVDKRLQAEEFRWAAWGASRDVERRAGLCAGLSCW